MTGAIHQANNAYLIWSTWSCYFLEQFFTPAFKTWISPKFSMFRWILSSIYFAHFSGCRTSFVYNCHRCYSILECYNLFPGVKSSVRSFCFIFKSFQASLESKNQDNICFTKRIFSQTFLLIPLSLQQIRTAMWSLAVILQLYFRFQEISEKEHNLIIKTTKLESVHNNLTLLVMLLVRL